MKVYFFTSYGTMYICRGFHMYGSDHSGDLYSFANSHCVNRKPTLAEAKMIYEVLAETSGFCTTPHTLPVEITE